MTEVTGLTIKTETSPSLETPRDTVLVQLPPIDNLVRLGIHTDSMGTLLRTLHDQSVTDPELLEGLKIEGRVLTEAQRRKLEESPIYQFYMQGRVARGDFVLPTSLRFTRDRIALLLQRSFSPSSLEGEIGYKTGYFSARELLDRWTSDDYRTNALLPMLGGVNEFRIGSDLLAPEKLARIAEGLFRAFVEQEESKLPAVLNNPVGFMSYSLSSLKLDKIFDKKENFKNLSLIILNKDSDKKIDKYEIFKKREDSIR